tara:strand:+ start:320 stop:844 length:525 start_codon:yes stop_codon:yes gene_type:complete
MKNINLYFFVIFLTCSRNSPEVLPSREGMPDQESWGVTIILTDEGIIRAKVKSGHLQKYNDKEFVMLDSNVTVDFFDKLEKHTSILTSDKAEINESSNNMKAIGNVKVLSDSGITLYSETLIWNSREEKLLTKDDIMITTLELDTLYGIGFESDPDLKNWKILKPSGVTGQEFR